MIATSFELPVVIMAGGKGTRMQPYSGILPKPLLLFENQPIIEKCIRNLINYGFSRFYLLLHEHSELIRTYLSAIPLPCEIYYIVEPQPLGTVGGIGLLAGQLKGDFVLCNCDNLGLFSYAEAIEAHKKWGADITILVKKQSIQVPFGVILNDGAYTVQKIAEKPIHTVQVSTGIHIVNSRIFSLLQPISYRNMPDLINQTASSGSVAFWDVGDGTWIDMSLIDGE